MFVAWRELRFARGRFLLIASVVALITLLVGFLSGLTGGLAAQNVSAVLALPGDRLVLEQPEGGDPSFSTSSLGVDTVEAWVDAEDVDSVAPVGIVMSRAQAGDAGDPSGVALFGIASGGPEDLRGPLAALAPGSDDEVGLSAGAAEELDVVVGDTITITGAEVTVGAVGEDLWFSHAPAIVLSPAAWREASARVGGSGEPTLLAVTGAADWDTLAAASGTAARTPLKSLTALETFRSEIGSLGLMITLLYGISALVVGAFFTVWTMQRAGDIAVLKALGATTRSLVLDSLGQALLVLTAGIGVGLAAVVALGALAGQALPFVLDPLITLAPALAMATLGLLGAASSLRAVISADPLTALGSHR